MIPIAVVVAAAAATILHNFAQKCKKFNFPTVDATHTRPAIPCYTLQYLEILFNTCNTRLLYLTEEDSGHHTPPPV